MKDFLKFHNIEPLNEKLVQQHSSKAFLKKKKKKVVSKGKTRPMTPCSWGPTNKKNDNNKERHTSEFFSELKQHCGGAGATGT